MLAYNNSIFEEIDFQSIRQIEKSEKYDKPLKIGKFGLGFNSIYHLTGKIYDNNVILLEKAAYRYFIQL